MFRTLAILSVIVGASAFAPAVRRVASSSIRMSSVEVDPKVCAHVSMYYTSRCVFSLVVFVLCLALYPSHSNCSQSASGVSGPFGFFDPVGLCPTGKTMLHFHSLVQFTPTFTSHQLV